MSLLLIICSLSLLPTPMDIPFRTFSVVSSEMWNSTSLRYRCWFQLLLALLGNSLEYNIFCWIFSVFNCCFIISKSDIHFTLCDSYDKRGRSACVHFPQHSTWLSSLSIINVYELCHILRKCVTFTAFNVDYVCDTWHYLFFIFIFFGALNCLKASAAFSHL